MKKIFLIFLLVGATLNSFSQKKQSEEGPTLDDFGRIGFFTDIVTNDPDFDGRALDKVKKGLERMLTLVYIFSSYLFFCKNLISTYIIC